MEQGVSPKIWGPILWRVLFDMAWEYDHTKTSKKPMAKWIFALGQILPCRFCRESFAIYSAEHTLPHALKTKTLFQWMHALKNKVNEKLRLQQAIDSKCASKEEFLQVDRALNDLPYNVLVQRARTNQFLNTRKQDRWMVMMLFTCNFAPRKEKIDTYMIVFEGLGFTLPKEAYQDQDQLFLELSHHLPPCHANMTNDEYADFVASLLEATSGFLKSTTIEEYHT